VTPRTVLVTGMSGLIGGAVLRHLGGTYALRALNRSAVPGVPCHRADIADLDAIQPAFAGVDAVVHLAANASMSAPFEDTLRANVVGTYNVFESARRAGVGRVVYASSGAVVSGYERDMPYRALVTGCGHEVGEWPMITHASPVRPAGLYGVSKVWGEALARHYVDAYGLSILCLRIGHVTKEDRPLSSRDDSVWCSQRDIVGMIDLCLRAPETLRFDVFFVVSDNRWGYRDLEHARDVLGFRPLDAAERRRASG
jgi:nucleoside-diphosphate-sugar epimerase